MKRNAFSLVEVLIAVAVIAILIVLFIPSIRTMQKSAESTKCANNLRQIGVGINSYAQDRDGMLPGPVFYGQSSAVSANSRGQLILLLAEYLNIKAESTAAHKYNLFICPSYAVDRHGKDGVCYGLESYGPTRPWGYPNPDKNGNPRLPMKIAALPGIEDTKGNPIYPSQTIAMRDISKRDYAHAEILPGWYSQLAENNVHVSHSNALFFDWHVERIPRTN